MEEPETQAPHIILIPTPGMGHLIPLVQFATRLISAHNFTTSFIIPTLGPPSEAQSAVLAGLPEAHSNYVFLPPPTLEDLPQSAKIETRMSHTMARSIPNIRARVRALTRRPTVLVVDLFGTDVFDICPEFGLRPYLFFTISAMGLGFGRLLLELDGSVQGEFRDMVEPVRIPGCVPVHGRDLVDPVQDRKDDAYKWVLHHTKRFNLAEGIFINSFMELEEDAILALQRSEPGYPPVYPVGPLVQSGEGGSGDGFECLKWLDQQPCGSVIYISFGSGGTLSYDQLIELAYGLEVSGVRFLWVVKSPNDKVANATFFGDKVEMDPLSFLPQGFLERTKERGLAIPSWAPQVKVLSHESTGGFLTHCGWNSILESVVHGVPLIAWPLFAEQKMNAVMLVEGMKLALRPTADENGLIGRGAIALILKDLMEGENGKIIRNKMTALKHAASTALSESGSSTKTLSEVALKWRSS